MYTRLKFTKISITKIKVVRYSNTLKNKILSCIKDISNVKKKMTIISMIEIKKSQNKVKGSEGNNNHLFCFLRMSSSGCLKENVCLSFCQLSYKKRYSWKVWISTRGRNSSGPSTEIRVSWCFSENTPGSNLRFCGGFGSKEDYDLYFGLTSLKLGWTGRLLSPWTSSKWYCFVSSLPLYSMDFVGSFC
jgi:hypothetical protein